jgi:hypothetical protein
MIVHCAEQKIEHKLSTSSAAAAAPAGRGARGAPPGGWGEPRARWQRTRRALVARGRVHRAPSRAMRSKDRLKSPSCILCTGRQPRQEIQEARDSGTNSVHLASETKNYSRGASLKPSASASASNHRGGPARHPTLPITSDQRRTTNRAGGRDQQVLLPCAPASGQRAPDLKRGIAIE